jgi:hypothetical protein
MPIVCEEIPHENKKNSSASQDKGICSSEKKEKEKPFSFSSDVVTSTGDLL